MEMPMKMVIIAAVAVLLLAILLTFFLRSSGTAVSGAEAQRIFDTQCQAYAQNGCSWDVTYTPEFNAYLGACRSIYGEERDSYSCLYTLCQGCFETANLQCAGLCNICNGHEAASVDRQTCCAQYSNQCSGAYNCGACA